MESTNMITSRAEVKKPELRYETTTATSISINFHDGNSKQLASDAAIGEYSRIDAYFTLDRSMLTIAYRRRSEDGVERIVKRRDFPATSIFSVDVGYDVE